MRPRLCVVLALLVPGCTDGVPPAGPPTIWTGDSWFEGQPNDVGLTWNATNNCKLDFNGCDSPPSEVLALDAVRCEGCTVVGDPTSGVSGGLRTIQVVGTTAGTTAVITVDLSYLPTGQTSTVTTSVAIDREIGVGAQCALVDKTMLYGIMEDVSRPEDLRPCGATRTATDVLLLFPYVTTLRGRNLFPFLTRFSDPSDPDLRPLSMLQFSQPPDGWATANVTPMITARGDLAYFTTPSASISLQTHLTSGADVETIVAVPPVR